MSQATTCFYLILVMSLYDLPLSFNAILFHCRIYSPQFVELLYYRFWLSYIFMFQPEMINVSLGMLQPTYLNRREPIIFSVPIPIFTVLVIRDRLNQQSFLTFFFRCRHYICPFSTPSRSATKTKQRILKKQTKQNQFNPIWTSFCVCVCAVFRLLGNPAVTDKFAYEPANKPSFFSVVFKTSSWDDFVRSVVLLNRLHILLYSRGRCYKNFYMGSIQKRLGRSQGKDNWFFFFFFIFGITPFRAQRMKNHL